MQGKSLLASGLYAGIIAGVVLGLLALLLVAPLIAKAEKYEAAGETGQGRAMGAMLGSVILGSVFGLMLALMFSYLGGRGSLAWPYAGLLAGFGGWLLINLIPAGAYPPNPPGLESLVPVSVRQFWWSVLILCEVIGVIVAAIVLRRSKMISKIGKVLPAFVILAAAVAVPLAYHVPDRPAPTKVPPDLIVHFRLVSLGTMLIFWLVLGLSMTFIGHLHEQEG